MAIQPDGDVALLTNIDADPAKRAEFWTLVEEHERTAGSDQMSCRFADRPDFWAAVVRRNDCPPTLRDQHAHADHDKVIRFDIDSGKAMRTFLEQQDGWGARDGDDQAFARFHDGRAGRTQYRIVGELPDELPMAGKVQLLRDFTEEFRHRRIPFVAVMHAPDHNNDEKNWHFHIVYYDRPCARITAAQIAELKRNGHDTGRLAPGMWDFAAATVKKDRVNRELWPLRQKKVAQVGNDRWIKDLRHSFAKMTNVQLEKAGVARRVDPRCHADMGIVADPQEHLGTRQAAAETRGTVTAAGTRNEERQSQAILAQIDQAHAQALADAERRVADLKRRLDGRPTTGDPHPLTEVEQNLIAAADLDRLAAGLRHADDRAVSRATNLKRMNGQLVRAIDADASAGSRRERQSRVGIVAGADRYLHILDVALRDDRRLLANCIDEAERRREAARLAEARLYEMAATAVVVRERPIVAASSQSVVADPVEQWIKQVEQRRPLIVANGSRLTVPGIRQPSDISGAHIQSRLATLYHRQQTDIEHVVRHLPAHRLSLVKRSSEGRSRYHLDDVDAELARTFFRYQDSPEITAAIRTILNPELVNPPVKTSSVSPSMASTALPIREPVTGPTTPPPSIAPELRPVIAEIPRSVVVARTDHAPAAPTPPITREPDRAPVVPSAPDPATVARDLVRRNIPLTFDADDKVDRAVLLAAKVDARIVHALQANPFLAGRVGLQLDQALKRLEAYARANPTNLIRKDRQVELGGDAPAELIALARFHGRAPLLQEKLGILHDELNTRAPAREAAAQQGHVEQNTPDAVTPPADPDILRGDAARQAALRAAWQRGR